MPTIAQKLCDDIVEPILAPSSNIIASTVPSRKSLKSTNGNSSIRFAKPTKSVLIEKKKIISEFEPTTKTVISKIKSEETILKKGFIDTGVNTFITGPLRCDNNCVTNVRKRENLCICKFGQKRNNFKNHSKQVQTLVKTGSKSDKACAHCIDTSNHGTQFVENHNSLLRTQISNTLLLKKSNEFQPQFSYRKSSNMTNRISNPQVQVSSRISRTMCHNAKRWALSNYSARGPDF